MYCPNTVFDPMTAKWLPLYTTAGRFECIKISYLKRTKILVKSETERITEWYAKGVGLVKSESHDMKGKPNGKTLLVKIVRKD